MNLLGNSHSLVITAFTDHGAHLDTRSSEDILLPNRYVKEGMQVGQPVDVFIYNDSEDRPVATTEKPFVEVGQIGYLEVVGTHPSAGVFLDWGLSKDLLLPYREQGNLCYQTGDGATVAVYLDKYTNRIAASTRLHNFLPDKKPNYSANTPVHTLVYDDSPLGYKCIIEKRYRGLLRHSENSGYLEPGDQFTAYVHKVRSDGKIDLRRDPSGYGRIDGLAQQILTALEASPNKQLPFDDRTPPDDIRATFGASKKSFKQAIGRLYKERKISFQDGGISLTRN